MRTFQSTPSRPPAPVSSGKFELIGSEQQGTVQGHPRAAVRVDLRGDTLSHYQRPASTASVPSGPPTVSTQMLGEDHLHWSWQQILEREQPWTRTVRKEPTTALHHPSMVHQHRPHSPPGRPALVGIQAWRLQPSPTPDHTACIQPACVRL